MNPEQTLIYDLDLTDLQEIVKSWSAPGYRVTQIWKGLYHNLWSDADRFTNLPLGLRTKIADLFAFQHLSPVLFQESDDKETKKTLFKLTDGQAVEAVLMRYEKRRTLCISTQAGCAMGCVFCATGQMGFRRNLSSGEIIEQVLFYARQLANEEDRITNIVIMGMGEPFHNYTATLQAIERLNHPDGFNFGARRFTISTVGLIPAIERFTEERRQVNLAISLHAADDELRSSLLPINDRYPIGPLLASCKQYVEATHRRITFEWALIRDVNDTQEQANKLAQLLQIFRSRSATMCHVNIIPLNPTALYPGEATTQQRAESFKSIINDHGIPCTIRIRRGIEIQAGCGQLAGDMVEP